MAKHKDPYDAFLAEVLDTIPEDKRKDFEETLKSDKVASVVKDKVMARSDYSRSKDELDDKVKTFESEVAEARTRINGWNDWYGKVTKEQAEKDKQLRAYEETFGKLDGTSNVTKYATAEDVTKTLNDTMAQRDAAAIKLASQMARFTYRYGKEFGEELDQDALIDYAMKHQVPFETAYERFVAPKVEAKRTERYEADIKKAREEGAREALSQHKLPVVSSHAEPHVLDLQDKVAKNSRDRVAAAVDDWMAGDHSGGPF